MRKWMRVIGAMPSVEKERAVRGFQKAKDRLVEMFEERYGKIGDELTQNS